MGKSSNVTEKTPKKGLPARWPFDPMSDPLQPGDHEPVRLPEESQRVQKQTGAGPRKRSAKR
jgi:hypothetical protein